MPLKKFAGTVKGRISRVRNSSPQTMLVKDGSCNKKVKARRENRLKQSSFNKVGNKNRDQRMVNRVWRRTVVFTKPSENRMPRLFRTDRLTGLPVDYERTVSRIMNYVNPQHSIRPRPEKVMEALLAQKLAGIVEMTKKSNQGSEHMRYQIHNLFNSQPLATKAMDNMLLSQFHCACKRGRDGCAMPETTLPPTYKSKFNYNSLKIYAK